QNRAAVAPGRGVFLSRRCATELVIGIRRKLYGFWREKPGGLMVTVPRVRAAPPVDDHRWPEGADDFDHVLQDFVAPNFFCFLRSFGIAEVFCASEKEFDTIAARGGEQLLRADEAELWSLLRAKIVLSAFAARERKERDFGVEAAGEIGKHGAGFVVGMGSDVKDPRGYTGVFDGFHCFWKSRARARGWRELGFGSGDKDQKQQ